MPVCSPDRSVAPSGPTVLCANSAHLDEIVQIHLESFRGFFLTSLGSAFLRELYRAFLFEPSGLCLVAIEHERVLGFVAGTTQPEGFFRRLLLNRWPAFLLTGATGLAMHPIRVGKKFYSALRYRGEGPADVPNATLLSSIGVAPSKAGLGIGNTLLNAFCKRAQTAGSSTVFLTTDRELNQAVNGFYLSNGFRLHSSFQKEPGRCMNLYTRVLETELAADRRSPLLHNPRSWGEGPDAEERV